MGQGFFEGTLAGVATGASIGVFTGTFISFWQGASARGATRAQLARALVPAIGTNVGFMAGVGGTFKAGETLMATWTGEDDPWFNSAFGGACAGVFMSFRAGSVPVMAASAAGCALMTTIIHLNGDKFR